MAYQDGLRFGAYAAGMVHRTRGQTDLLFFFFNDTVTTEIYTLSLHDALPISTDDAAQAVMNRHQAHGQGIGVVGSERKSTRRNSSHVRNSNADFCLNKNK